MSLDKPKVTVLMSVYNGEKHLREAVDSILDQTYKGFEFIIINDGSTDKTLKILKNYNDSRIKIINNEENIGLTRSLNKGLKFARGHYIARQDADDISNPDRLQKEVDFLAEHSDYAAVGSFIKVISGDGKELSTIKKPITDEDIRDFLKIGNCIAHGSAMVRAGCMHDVKGYDETIPRAQDYDLWLRLSEKYKLANIPEYLYLWRRHEGNISVKNYNEQIHYGEVTKVKAKRRKEKRNFFDNSSLPGISVLMANYNNAEYVGEAIRSVLNQTFKNWELIIVDDASKDDSVDKIRPFSNDKRIRFFRNKVNEGYIKVLKKMVYESRADIFGILDSDDVLTENALQDIYDTHTKKPDCGFIYSQFMYCDSNLNPVKLGYCRAVPSGDTNLRCNCVSAFRTFKKKDYFKTQGFDEKIVGAEDKDIIYKMEEVTHLFFIDKVLYKHRVLPYSQTHDPVKYRIAFESFAVAKYNAYKRRLYSDVPNITKWEMLSEFYRFITYFLKKADFKRARRFFFRSLNLLKD